MVFAVSEGKFLIGAVAAFAGLVVLIVYFPVAVYEEVVRQDGERLPEWMGTARGRRNRIRVAVGVLGGAALAFALAVRFGD